MSLSAKRTEPWVLEDSDCMDVLSKVTENGTTALYSSKHFIIQIARIVIGVSSFAEDAGDTKSLFSVYTGGGLTLTYYSSGKKYRCTRDNVKVLDYVTGEARQTQVWEYLSEPELVPYSEFAGDDE